jgi:hypothetical protein
MATLSSWAHQLSRLMAAPVEIQMLKAATVAPRHSPRVAMAELAEAQVLEVLLELSR